MSDIADIMGMGQRPTAAAAAEAQALSLATHNTSAVGGGGTSANATFLAPSASSSGSVPGTGTNTAQTGPLPLAGGAIFSATKKKVRKVPREVASLMLGYDDHPIYELQAEEQARKAALSAATAAGVKGKFKPAVKWRWAPIISSSRRRVVANPESDMLSLYHWSKTESEAMDYRFAKNHKMIKMVDYTDEEYQMFGTVDPSWTREETDALFKLSRRLDLRFLVVQDQLDDYLSIKSNANSSSSSNSTNSSSSSSSVAMTDDSSSSSSISSSSASASAPDSTATAAAAAGGSGGNRRGRSGAAKSGEVTVSAVNADSFTIKPEELEQELLRQQQQNATNTNPNGRSSSSRANVSLFFGQPVNCNASSSHISNSSTMSASGSHGVTTADAVALLLQQHNSTGYSSRPSSRRNSIVSNNNNYNNNNKNTYGAAAVAAANAPTNIKVKPEPGLETKDDSNNDDNDNNAALSSNANNATAVSSRLPSRTLEDLKLRFYSLQYLLLRHRAAHLEDVSALPAASIPFEAYLETVRKRFDDVQTRSALSKPPPPLPPPPPPRPLPALIPPESYDRQRWLGAAKAAAAAAAADADAAAATGDGDNGVKAEGADVKPEGGDVKPSSAAGAAAAAGGRRTSGRNVSAPLPTGSTPAKGKGGKASSSKGGAKGSSKGKDNDDANASENDDDNNSSSDKSDADDEDEDKAPKLKVEAEEDDGIEEGKPNPRAWTYPLEFPPHSTSAVSLLTELGLPTDTNINTLLTAFENESKALDVGIKRVRKAFAEGEKQQKRRLKFLQKQEAQMLKLANKASAKGARKGGAFGKKGGLTSGAEGYLDGTTGGAAAGGGSGHSAKRHGFAAFGGDNDEDDSDGNNNNDNSDDDDTVDIEDEHIAASKGVKRAKGGRLTLLPSPSVPVNPLTTPSKGGAKGKAKGYGGGSQVASHLSSNPISPSSCAAINALARKAKGGSNDQQQQQQDEEEEEDYLLTLGPGPKHRGGPRKPPTDRERDRERAAHSHFVSAVLGGPVLGGGIHGAHGHFDADEAFTDGSCYSSEGAGGLTSSSSSSVSARGRGGGLAPIPLRIAALSPFQPLPSGTHLSSLSSPPYNYPLLLTAHGLPRRPFEQALTDTGIRKFWPLAVPSSASVAKGVELRKALAQAVLLQARLNLRLKVLSAAKEAKEAKLAAFAAAGGSRGGLALTSSLSTSGAGGEAPLSPIALSAASSSNNNLSGAFAAVATVPVAGNASAIGKSKGGNSLGVLSEAVAAAGVSVAVSTDIWESQGLLCTPLDGGVSTHLSIVFNKASLKWAKSQAELMAMSANTVQQQQAVPYHISNPHNANTNINASASASANASAQGVNAHPSSGVFTGGDKSTEQGQIFASLPPQQNGGLTSGGASGSTLGTAAAKLSPEDDAGICLFIAVCAPLLPFMALARKQPNTSGCGATSEDDIADVDANAMVAMSDEANSASASKKPKVLLMGDEDDCYNAETDHIDYNSRPHHTGSNNNINGITNSARPGSSNDSKTMATKSKKSSSANPGLRMYLDSLSTPLDGDFEIVERHSGVVAVLCPNNGIALVAAQSLQQCLQLQQQQQHQQQQQQQQLHLQSPSSPASHNVTPVDNSNNNNNNNNNNSSNAAASASASSASASTSASASLNLSSAASYAAAKLPKWRSLSFHAALLKVRPHPHHAQSSSCLYLGPGTYMTLSGSQAAYLPPAATLTSPAASYTIQECLSSNGSVSISSNSIVALCGSVLAYYPSYLLTSLRKYYNNLSTSSSASSAHGVSATDASSNDVPPPYMGHLAVPTAALAALPPPPPPPPATTTPPSLSHNNSSSAAALNPAAAGTGNGGGSSVGSNPLSGGGESVRGGMSASALVSGHHQEAKPRRGRPKGSGTKQKAQQQLQNNNDAFNSNANGFINPNSLYGNAGGYANTTGAMMTMGSGSEFDLNTITALYGVNVSTLLPTALTSDCVTNLPLTLPTTLTISTPSLSTTDPSLSTASSSSLSTVSVVVTHPARLSTLAAAAYLSSLALSPSVTALAQRTQLDCNALASLPTAQLQSLLLSSMVPFAPPPHTTGAGASETVNPLDPSDSATATQQQQQREAAAATARAAALDQLVSATDAATGAGYSLKLWQYEQYLSLAAAAAAATAAAASVAVGAGTVSPLLTVTGTIVSTTNATSVSNSGAEQTDAESQSAAAVGSSIVVSAAEAYQALAQQQQAQSQVLVQQQIQVMAQVDAAAALAFNMV